jgi:large subunit ribosomal protein LP0
VLLLLAKPQFSFDHTSNMPLSQEKKEAYFIKLEGYLNEYKKIFLVNVDNVGSRQMQLIRAGLRGHAEILMGKNTMIRKIIAGFLAKNGEDHPISKLTPLMRQNVGFVFTNGSLADIRQMIQENRVPAPARVGAIAPVDVYCPAGGTGCDPGQTAFFQALNIPTKISKGQIEIVNPVRILCTGDRVGNSEAVLCQKLDLMPFTYGLVIVNVYDDGNVFSPAILDITDEVLGAKIGSALKAIAAMSLALGFPTIASLPHSFAKAFSNVCAIAVETGVSEEETKAYVSKLYVDPEQAAKDAAAAAEKAAAAAAAPAKKADY